MARPGPPRPSHWRWPPVSARSSARWQNWSPADGCARSGEPGPGAGCRRRLQDSRRSCYSPPRCRSNRVVSNAPIQQRHKETEMTRSTAEAGSTAPAIRAADIVREYGPFAGADKINGVTHDGHRVWAATGAKLVAFDPGSGETTRTLEVACDAGTAFDGTYLYQIAEKRIDKIDPATGDVVASIPAPGNGGDSGLTWAEGSLWVGQYRDRKIVQIDPDSGKVLRTIESNRFVTGVTW